MVLHVGVAGEDGLIIAGLCQGFGVERVMRPVKSAKSLLKLAMLSCRSEKTPMYMGLSLKFRGVYVWFGK